jgi:DNA-binding response OmpR family regulator
MSNLNRTILIIEDDADTCDLVGRLLTMQGYSVRLASNGWEGLLALEDRVDLILLDMMLPGMDGLTFLKSLRGQKMGQLIPVVMMTAMDREEVLAKVRPFGVTEVLQKGGDLMRQLKHVLSRHVGKSDPQARVTLPDRGSLVRPYLDLYLRMLTAR